MTAPYSSSRYAYEGTETTETSIVRTGGAVDPNGQAQSRKIVTSANAQWLRPFRCEPWAIWNETVGADVTVTVYGMVNSSSLLTTEDLWMDVEYLGDVSSTLGKIVSTTKANVLAIGAAGTSDSSIWSDLAAKTWDPATVALVTLSNGNLTATNTGTTETEQGARLAGTLSAGKVYFEITFVTVLGGNNLAAGIAPVQSYHNVGTGVFSVMIYKSGNVYVNAVNTLPLGALVSGNVIGFAIDFDNSKAWLRKGASGNWNNNAGYDPATNTGGVTVPNYDMAPVCIFGSVGGVAGNVITANFGASGFVGAVPSGFEPGWHAVLTPFKLVATLSSPQPGRPGLIHVRPKIGKPSATFYLDPQIELTPASAAPSATHKSSRYAYEGTETTETTIIRTGGTPHSRKIVTTANAQWLRPYRAEPFAIWNATTGADVTVTVYGNAVGALPLNDEVFLEAEYLADSASTLGKIISTTKANVLATGVAVASDSSVWITPTGVITWDTTDHPNVTLSGGDLVATNTSTTTALQGTHTPVSTSETTGKYYFEVTFTTVIAGGNVGAGIASTSSGIDSVGNTSSGGNMVYRSGNFWQPGSSVGSIGALVSGDVVGIAVDLDNRRTWFRKAPSGNWNGNASYDPVTNTGGATMAAGAMIPYCTFGGSSGVAGNVTTANFGASAFVGSVPSGFAPGWSSVHALYTPFKLVATLSSPQPAHAGLINVRVKAGKPSATLYIDPTPVLT